MSVKAIIKQVGLFKEAFRDFFEDGALRLGAALSFYTVLSLAPLLLVVVAVAGLIGGREAIGHELVNQMRSLVGEAGAEVAKTVLESADNSDKSVIALIIGMVTLIFGATGVFVQLQEALNIIWEVEAKPKGGIFGFIRKRLLSLAMVMAISFLLLVSLVISAALAALNTQLGILTDTTAWLGQTLNVVISLIVMTLLFALMFKVLPDTKIQWRDVMVGALITSVLMNIGKFALGLYLGRSSIGSAYGAAGSLVVLLVWIYYSSLIVFFGAELTQVYANRRKNALKDDSRLIGGEGV